MIKEEYIEYLSPFQYKHCQKCWKKECNFFCDILEEAQNKKRAADEKKLIDDYKRRLMERGYINADTK